MAYNLTVQNTAGVWGGTTINNIKNLTVILQIASELLQDITIQVVSITRY